MVQAPGMVYTNNAVAYKHLCLLADSLLLATEKVYLVKEAQSVNANNGRHDKHTNVQVYLLCSTNTLDIL